MITICVAKTGRTVTPMLTLDEAIEHAEDIAVSAIGCECREEHRQLAEWLSILKKAKFEYDEAWKILTHPTPDVRYPDINRAKMILDVFGNSLGRMEC
jgi:hypothetical protein